MSLIEDLQTAIQAAAAAAGPSVVGIGRHQRGAGVVVADGHVLTNAHNLRGDEVTVSFADGRSTVGNVVGVDHDGDLAVIAVDTTGAAPIGWATEASVAVGSVVFALAPSRSAGSRITFGSVSAVGRAFRGPGGRRISGSIEHTAPLASVWCWYKVGSKDERAGLTGVSHWVEHMNFKGTTNIPRDQVKGIIEEYGGSWNGYTWIDQTTYFETATRDALDRSLVALFVAIDELVLVPETLLAAAALLAGGHRRQSR